MRITTQAQSNDIAVASHPRKEAVESVEKASTSENSLNKIMQAEQRMNITEAIPKEKVQKAVDALNEFMTVQNRNSKFVMHDGLDRYFVEVVDAETEEVIREVPPRKLLDAFYTMQKFLGMIIDEKI